MKKSSRLQQQSRKSGLLRSQLKNLVKVKLRVTAQSGWSLGTASQHHPPFKGSSPPFPHPARHRWSVTFHPPACPMVSSRICGAPPAPVKYDMSHGGQQGQVTDIHILHFQVLFGRDGVPAGSCNIHGEGTDPSTSIHCGPCMGKPLCTFGHSSSNVCIC
jgi:hypothetical protein